MPLVWLGVILVLVASTGIVFNAYILALTCGPSVRQARTVTHLLLLHLAVVNLLIETVFITSLVPKFFLETWLEESVCYAIGCCWIVLHVSAIWSVTLLNIDKYVAIASPLHYTRFFSPYRAGFLLIASWVLAFCIGLPPLLIPSFGFSVRQDTGCHVSLVSAPFVLGNTYACITCVLACLLPALLVISANCRILDIARHHRHRIVAALWDVTVSAQATVTQQRSHFYLTRYRGRSGATTLLQLVGTFAILYLPTAGCLLYEAVTHQAVNTSMSTTAYSLLVCAPTVNGFVYGIKSKVLRKSLKNILRKKIYKREVDHEIQSRVPSTGSRRPSLTPSLSLPIQRHLTRRMSEIIIQPSNSDNAQGKAQTRKLLRRSTELCWRPKAMKSAFYFPDFAVFWSRSVTEDHQNVSTPPSLTESVTLQSENGRAYKEMACKSPSTSYSNGSPAISQVISYHRQSLRRALFAKNKQKSLDVELEAYNPGDKAAVDPPRSTSECSFELASGSSLSRPLLVREGENASPDKKNKKVSWSAGNFSEREPENEVPDCRSLDRGKCMNNFKIDFYKLKINKEVKCREKCKYSADSIAESSGEETEHLMCVTKT